MPRSERKNASHRVFRWGCVPTGGRGRWGFRALVGSRAGLAQASDAPLADAALAIAPALGVVIAVGGLISTLGFVSGSALGTPRYLYAVAREGQLPRGLAAIHARHQSPHVAVLTTASLAVVCVVPFDYRALIGMSNVAVAVQYLATCLAVQRLGTEKPRAALRARSAVRCSTSAVWPSRPPR